MSITEIKSSEALSAGAHLWIVPDLESSTWARDIDWNLAFQMKRATIHKAPAWQEGLSKIMQEWEFDPPALGNFAETPLMIASEFLLPNKMTVQISFRGDAKQWVAHAKQVWQRLGCPEARVFLPDSLSIGDVRDNWKKDHDAGVVQIVSSVENEILRPQ